MRPTLVSFFGLLEPEKLFVGRTSIKFQSKPVQNLHHSLNQSKMCNNFLDLSQIFTSNLLIKEVPELEMIQTKKISEDPLNLRQTFKNPIDEQVQMIDSKTELVYNIQSDAKKLEDLSANLVKDFKENNLTELEAHDTVRNSPFFNYRPFDD